MRAYAGLSLGAIICMLLSTSPLNSFMRAYATGSRGAIICMLLSVSILSFGTIPTSAWPIAPTLSFQGLPPPNPPLKPSPVPALVGKRRLNTLHEEATPNPVVVLKQASKIEIRLCSGRHHG